jgi:hypothetical protein
MTRSDFVELDVLHDPDGLGLVAPITVRENAGYKAFSFAIFKEFERKEGGPTQRTAYMNERHLVAARKLLDLVETRIRAEQDKWHTHARRAAK